MTDLRESLINYLKEFLDLYPHRFALSLNH